RWSVTAGPSTKSPLPGPSRATKELIMSDRKPRKQKNYTVGYGRPPEATRFKPGQSGNPKGRRKGVKSIGTILEEIIRQLVTVTEGQKKRRLSVLEVALRRLANDAMRGDLKAMKF